MSFSMVGRARDSIDSKIAPIPEMARDLKERGARWCTIGDNKYGEGSSREHAILELRYLGAVVVIAKSFARIHETNLKK